MAEPTDHAVIKVIEVIGISGESFDDAIEQAVRKAADSISGITGVEVMSMKAEVADGSITRYQASLKLAFIVK